MGGEGRRRSTQRDLPERTFAFVRRAVQLCQVCGVDVLCFLMEEHGLTQSDLPEIGSQGVVSEVLRGKREPNIRQIRALAKRFQVSPAVFIEGRFPAQRARSYGYGKEDNKKDC